jgi:hypothetical protein
MGILIVVGDDAAAAILRNTLAAEGYASDRAADGTA